MMILSFRTKRERSEKSISIFVIPAQAGIPNRAMQQKKYFVYILTNKRRGALYIGVTSNIVKRLFEHKQATVDGFTRKYHVHRLVFLEEALDIYSAIQREKQLKKWNRQWKINLIEKTNPDWDDVSNDIV